MDFEIQYTDEMEEFRKEVRAWLDEHAVMPKELGEPAVDEQDETREQHQWKSAFMRKLGHKGWLYPTFPKEYGGGGLTFSHDIVISEELVRRDARVLPGAGANALGPMMTYGTEQQKQELVRPLLMGEWRAWALWTEPDCGVDLAALKTTALRDGDEFVFNGQKTYISGLYEADYFAILAVTDPAAPRHANLGYFFMPANLPGVRVQMQDLINRGGQHDVFFDNVRVPAKYLIGGETEGWRVTQGALDAMYGGAGATTGARRWFHIDRFVDYWRESDKERTVAHGDRARELVVQAYIRKHADDLIWRRNFWQSQTRTPQTYEPNQSFFSSRYAIVNESEHLLDLYGMHSMVRDTPWEVFNGHLEHGHRWALMSTHGGGSWETDKLSIARWIGLSRTQKTERPRTR